MIEFISYDSAYPNLCRGVLTVKIDGEIHKFGSDSYSFNKMGGKIPNNWHDKFWISGGSARFNKDCTESYIAKGQWVVDDFVNRDEIIDKYIDELIYIFNKNVPYGCCGGCL